MISTPAGEGRRRGGLRRRLTGAPRAASLAAAGAGVVWIVASIRGLQRYAGLPGVAVSPGQVARCGVLLLAVVGCVAAFLVLLDLRRSRRAWLGAGVLLAWALPLLSLDALALATNASLGRLAGLIPLILLQQLSYGWAAAAGWLLLGLRERRTLTAEQDAAGRGARP
jgi:hypothetical protein